MTSALRLWLLLALTAVPLGRIGAQNPGAGTITITNAGGSGIGFVKSIPAGIDCTLGVQRDFPPTPPKPTASGACSVTFPVGTVVTLNVTTPQSGLYEALGGACSFAPCQLTASASGPLIVTARFNAKVPLVLQTDGGTGKGSLTVRPRNGSPYSCVGLCTPLYPQDSTYTITAESFPGSQFTAWGGACAGTPASSPCTLTLTGGLTVTGTFTPTTTGAIAVSASGNGRITSTPAAIDCTFFNGVASGTCTGTFVAGTVVSLAIASNQNGPTTVTGPCIGYVGYSCDIAVPASGTVNVRADFTSIPIYALTVGGAGTGGGQVDGPFTCYVRASLISGRCFASTTDPNQTYTLTATPFGGSRFLGWTGACTGTAACTVTMSQSRTVIASFVPYAGGGTIAVRLLGTNLGTGRVVSSPEGIDCTAVGGVTSGTCSINFVPGTQVTLSTLTAPGYSLGAQWSGACTGLFTCTLTAPADGATSVATIDFSTNQIYKISIGGAGDGSGRVTGATAPAIDCHIVASRPSGPFCSPGYRYAPGQVETFTAVADPASRFIGWTGACTGTGTCTVTVTQSTVVVASFVATGQTATLSVGAAGPGSGKVMSNPAGISCFVNAATLGGTCWSSYTLGSTVTLTAAANPGSSFLGWTGACTGTGSCAVTLDQAKTVVASYVLSGGNFAAIPTPEAAVQDLLTGEGLTAAERRTVDVIGNDDGAFDLGDVLALLDHAQVRLPEATMRRLMELPADTRRSFQDAAPVRRPTPDANNSQRR